MDDRYLAVPGEPITIDRTTDHAIVTMIISDKAEYNLPLTVQFQSKTPDFFAEGVHLLMQKYPQWSRHLSQALARLSSIDDPPTA